MAFKPNIRRQVLHRDKWTCRGIVPELEIPCIGDFLDGLTRDYRSGWMVHASHIIDRHGSQNPEDGMCQCVTCHALYHLHYQESKFSKLILRTSTIRHYGWIKSNGVDESVTFDQLLNWYHSLTVRVA